MASAYITLLNQRKRLMQRDFSKSFMTPFFGAPTPQGKQEVDRIVDGATDAEVCEFLRAVGPPLYAIREDEDDDGSF